MSPPPPAAVHETAQGEWSTGFCGCCSDCSTCCITCWCPCITFGQIAEIVDEGATTCGTAGALFALIHCITGFGFIYSCCYRTKLRRQYNLKGDECCDCLAHACCMLCAMTQEHRELTKRGYDVALGWNENLRRQNQNPVMGIPPTAPSGMKR